MSDMINKTKELSTYELEYLEKFKNALLSLELNVTYIDYNQSSEWSSVNQDKVYNQNLMCAFIDDIKKGHPNYRYDFNTNVANFYEEIYQFFINPSISDELKLNLYDLMGFQTHLKTLLGYGQKYKKAELLMALLKKDLTYPATHEVGFHFAVDRLNLYYQIIVDSEKFATKEVVENFIYHVKNCQIQLTEKKLSHLFLDLFSRKYLYLLNNAFGFKEEPICTDIEHTYSMMYLSIKQLKTCGIGYSDIVGITDIIQYCNHSSITNFPLFQVLTELEHVAIPLLFEQKEGNAQKIRMLFEQLIEEFELFHENGDALIEAMKHINEKVDLENSVLQLDKLNHKTKI